MPRPFFHQSATESVTWLTATIQKASRAFSLGDFDLSGDFYLSVLAKLPEQVEGLHGLALVRARQNQPEAAEELFQRALRLDPKNSALHFDHATFCASERRFPQALQDYERAFRLGFPHQKVQFQLALIHRQVGEIHQAIALLEEIVFSEPNWAAAHYQTGVCLSLLKRFPEAIAAYKRALKITPMDLKLINDLGVAFEATGDVTEALAYYKRVLRADPQHPEAHNNLGAVLAVLGKRQEAIDHYRSALAVKPTLATAENNLGLAFQGEKRFPEAIEHYQQAIALNPNFAEAYNNLGTAFNLLRRFSEAEAPLRRALLLKMDFPEAHNNLGSALHELGRDDEALWHLEQAEALRPNFPDTLNNRGIVLIDQGKVAEALQCFSKAVDLAPHEPVYYRNLFNFERVRPDDAPFRALIEVANGSEKLEEDRLIDLHFALGKAYQDCDQTKLAFHHLKLGNALKRKQINYNEEIDLQLLRKIPGCFVTDLPAARPPVDVSGPKLIFVLGMPRSGTSLVEQILSSLPGVFGAGELQNFSLALRTVLGPTRSFPEAISELATTEWARMGGIYRASIQTLFPGAPCVIDKLPGNFLYVGLIHLALPDAKIIHLRRDPLDTCISCFSRLFSNGLEFSYDLEELGRYYQAYERLMQHWRQSLPASAMNEVHYEELVSDFEPTARKLIEACELEWNDACLEFYKTERSVKTASAAQVRQPIYKESVGRWHKAKDELQPLLKALGLPIGEAAG